MYRHSPVRNQRSKGIKIKHVVQLCLLIAVCFWLIFQVKRSHDNKKHFDTKLSNAAADDEILKFGRKDLLHPNPKLEETTTAAQEEDETKHEEEEQDEDKIEEEEKDDENEQEKSSMEIDPDEVDIIDEDKETEEEEENEEKDGHSQTDDEHTHEAREEHYKADDASSAVITHDDVKNATLDVANSSDIIGNSENETATIIQEKDSESMNATTSVELEYRENGPPANSTRYQVDSSATVTETTTQNSEMLKSNGEENASDQSKSDSSDPTHLEEKQVRNLPEAAAE